MLAAFYLFVRTLERGSRVLMLLAIFREYMSLWTYESPIMVILLAPLLLLWLRREAVRKWRPAPWGWYAVPVIYLVVTGARYAHSGGRTCWLR